MYKGTRYRGYVYVNPSTMKVIRSSYSEGGISVDNVYYDNVIHICVYEGRRMLYGKDITKKAFAGIFPEDILSQMILADMNFMGVDNKGYQYQAISVSMPAVFILCSSYRMDIQKAESIPRVLLFLLLCLSGLFAAVPAFVIISVAAFAGSVVPASATFKAAAFASVIGARLVFGSFTQLFRHRYLIDFFFQEILYALEIRLFLFIDESKGYTVIVGTCRTSDAVHVIFTVMRHIIIDNQTDVIYIDTARHNIGGNQNIDSSRLELVQYFLTLRLL